MPAPAERDAAPSRPRGRDRRRTRRRAPRPPRRSPSSFACRCPSGESCPSSQPEAIQRSLSVVVECVSKTISIAGARACAEPSRLSPSSWNQKNPTAPGPACVPTTAPSVAVNSISAFGRTRQTSSESVPTHSAAFAWAIATRRPGPSVVASTKRRSNSASAFCSPAHARDGNDHAVLHAEHRSHVEQRAGERLRPADAAAALEVLERLDGEQHVAVARGSDR